jgi:NADPH-dependent ferric siderophore reductase
MEIADIPSPAGGDVTTDSFLARVPEASLLRLRVESVAELPSGLREVRLTGQDLSGFGYEPGQDLMIPVHAADGRIIRRRYTIRRLVGSSLDLQVLTDSDGPGARWARALGPGDEVEAIGPRGKIFVAAEASWHLFFCDDVSVPAVSAMVESLPLGMRAIVFADVRAPDGKVSSEADVEWEWLLRGSSPAGSPASLVVAASSVRVPAGVGHAYVFGEAGVVSRVAGVLGDRGVPREWVSAKAYWGLGRANASHGEPLKG